ncbi:MAG: hypothetical protein WCC87_08530, partial [Candidatus Korobacteraceae bacterium]
MTYPSYESAGIRARLQRLPEKSEKQIPHRLKPVRDDKYKALVTAHLKVRPFKLHRTRLFQLSSRAYGPRELMKMSSSLGQNNSGAEWQDRNRNGEVEA